MKVGKSPECPKAHIVTNAQALARQYGHVRGPRAGLADGTPGVPLTRGDDHPVGPRGNHMRSKSVLVLSFAAVGVFGIAGAQRRRLPRG